MELIEKIDKLKKDIKQSILINNIEELEEILCKHFLEYKEHEIVNKFRENEFVSWIFSTIQKIIDDNQLQLENINKIGKLLRIFAIMTDKSSYFCECLINNQDLYRIIKLLINFSDLSENGLGYHLVCIINNITFQCQSSYFNDSDIKVFLIQRANFSEKIPCIMTLMRLFSQEDIQQYNDVIITIISDIVENLKNCCQSENFRLDHFGLVEILEQIKTLCKSEQVKSNLMKNQTIIDCLNLILNDEKYVYFSELARTLIDLLQITNY